MTDCLDEMKSILAEMKAVRDENAAILEEVKAREVNIKAMVQGMQGMEFSTTLETKPFVSEITQRPSKIGNSDSILTAFDGDLSAVQFPVSHKILNPGTLGNPASGYLYTNEAYPHVTALFNNSGQNHATGSSDTNIGRTGAAAYRCMVHQYGDGDLAAFNASAFVMGKTIKDNTFIGNPAGVLFNGQINAGQNYVYLNPYEILCQDFGKDVACVGHVINLERMNATGAKECFWNGMRIQSKNKNVDVGMMLSGGYNWGMSFTQAHFDRAALALRAGQKIEMNAMPGGWNVQNLPPVDYIEYTTTINGIHVVVNNQSCLQIHDRQITTVSPLMVYGPVGFNKKPPQGIKYVGGHTDDVVVKSLVKALDAIGLVKDVTS